MLKERKYKPAELGPTDMGKIKDKADKDDVHKKRKVNETIPQNPHDVLSPRPDYFISASFAWFKMSM